MSQRGQYGLVVWQLGKRRRWSVEQDEELRQAYLQGEPVDRLAGRFGSSQDNIRQRLSRLGVRRPKEASRAHARPPRAAPSPTVGLTLTARLAQLQGLAPPLEAEPEPLLDEALRAWVESPEAFFKWLGVTLFDYQREALGIILGNDRSVLVWPRQHGKDMVSSLYALWVALLKPGSVIVCVSPSQRQSDLWFTQGFKSFALSRKELRDSIVDMSQSELTFANGSRVYSLPSGAQGSATIRGFTRVSVLVVNEAAWVSEETFQAIQPFLAVSQGAKLILCSTPFGQTGHFWRAFNNGLYGRHHVTEIKNPLISPETVEKDRASMDPMSFAAEWQAMFISGQTSYFPSELLQRCTEAYPLNESPPQERRGRRFYLGCDWARVAGADRTVLTVVAVEDVRPPVPSSGLARYTVPETPETPILGRGRVLWIREFEGVDYVTQAGYVLWLHQQWHFRTVFSDASNHAMTDLLTSKGVPVEPVNFTVPGKVELFGRLKNAMEAGRLVLPNHPDLLRELATFQYKISEHGNLLLHHTEGGHDDYPDSLALAAKVITMETPRAGGIAIPSTRSGIPSTPPVGAWDDIMERLGAASVSAGGPAFITQKDAERAARRGDPWASDVAAAMACCWALIDARKGTHCRRPMFHSGEHEG